MSRMDRCVGVGAVALLALGYVALAYSGSSPSGPVALAEGAAGSGRGRPATGVVEAGWQAEARATMGGRPAAVGDDEGGRRVSTIPAATQTPLPPALAWLTREILGPSVDLDPPPLPRAAPISLTPTDR